MDQIVPLLAFATFIVLWVAFAYAPVANQGSLDAAWSWVREQNIVVQIAVWLLLLPVVAGLWVWESGWPPLLRLVIVGGLAFATLYVFFLRFLFSGRA